MSRIEQMSKMQRDIENGAPQPTGGASFSNDLLRVAENPRTCVVCGIETRTPKVLMHNDMHRYVCSSKCMTDFYT